VVQMPLISPENAPLAVQAADEHVVLILISVGIGFTAEEGRPIGEDAFDETTIGGEAEVEVIRVEGFYPCHLVDQAAKSVAFFEWRIFVGIGQFVKAGGSGREEGFGAVRLHGVAEGVKEIEDLGAGGIVERDLR
jgi:hypothetical protein